MKSRYDLIDIFRGIALLQMIIWQIFDFFYVKDIYSDAPYYIEFLNMPVNGIGVGLFAFIAGVSVYTSISERKKHPHSSILSHLFKRYGSYIILSLLFTTFVFGFNVFYTWSEAIQGIGFAALVAGIILLFTKSTWITGLLGIAIIIIQPWLRAIADSIEIFSYDFLSIDIFANAASVFLNATVRGFFSLSHLLPIVLFGILLGRFIVENKSPAKRSLNLGMLFVVASLILHFTLNSINYYDRSISYILFYIGLSFLLFALIAYLKLKSRVLIMFGQVSLIAYVAHFIFIYKPLSLLGIESTFGLLASWMYAITSVIILYFFSKWLLQHIHKIKPKFISMFHRLERHNKIALIFSIVWFVISIISILNLDIKGIYFYVWTAILFLGGSTAMFSIIHVVLAKKISLRIVIWSILILTTLGGLTYLLWDFDYSLTVKNIRGHDVIANITITNSKGQVVAQTDNSEMRISLQKGRYALTVKRAGYVANTSSIINTIGFKRNNDIVQTVFLAPSFINLSHFNFTDPTLSKKLFPQIRVSGQNVLEEHVNQTIDASSLLMYGDYSVEIFDENFEFNTFFNGDTFDEGDHIILNPNNKFILLTLKEFSYVNNFLRDYLSLNENIDSRDKGLPKQFYLYSRDLVISLGKIIFLFCEHQIYDQNAVELPLYFIPKKMEFIISDSVSNPAQCYISALEGKIPKKIADDSVQHSIYKKITNNQGNFDYSLPELNSEKRRLEISFTFDIESGRYVSQSNSPAVSPCESEDYATGLEEDELICDEPALVAWMSPRGGKITYQDHPYPQVSGILGFREILSYSELYGFPTTNFIVKKDILAFEKLEPEIIDRTKKLIEEGLFEVAAHTLYHTNLGEVELPVARSQVKESRKFLEQYFNVKVYGFRAPYLSKIGNKDTHEQALIDAGYEYYSESGLYPDGDIIQKPWNSWNSEDSSHDYFSIKTSKEVRQLIFEKPYIITLDHPWNIAYTHEDIVHETPNGPDNLRTNILTTISNGAIPVLTKDIKII